MSFKLAYSTLRWQTPDLESLLRTLKQCGWQGWEARQSLDWLGTPQRVRRICERTEMPCCAFTARHISLDGDRVKREHDLRRIDFAAELGVDCFMFMGAAKPKDRPVNDGDLRALADLAEAMADYACQYNLDVCYHPHIHTTVDSKEDWIRFADMLEKCKICLDVSHIALWGYEPSQAFRDYANRLVYVHLQDCVEDTTMVELGDGTMFDFPQTLQTLTDIGYRRWVTACPGQTTHLTDEQKMIKNREYLKSLGI